MTAGGELTVRVANRCETGGSTLLVQISDTGRGIPDGVLDNLFNPFVTTKPRGSSASPSPEASLTRIGPPWDARTHVGRPGCPSQSNFP